TRSARQRILVGTFLIQITNGDVVLFRGLDVEPYCRIVFGERSRQSSLILSRLEELWGRCGAQVYDVKWTTDEEIAQISVARAAGWRCAANWNGFGTSGGRVSVNQSPHASTGNKSVGRGARNRERTISRDRVDYGIAREGRLQPPEFRRQDRQCG